MIASIIAFAASVFQDLVATTAAVAARRGGSLVWRRVRALLGPSHRATGDESPRGPCNAANVSTGRGSGIRKGDAADCLELKDSTIFFSERFASAFPGCRGLCEFDNPREALHRLDVLLQTPISANVGGSTFTPVWWFRGSSALHVESYRRERLLFFDKLTFYFSEIEYYRMKRIVAVNEGSYFRNFVYVEVDPMPPTGLYSIDVARSVEQLGYAREEYGEYGRWWKRQVTREEYDDRATVVNGRVKNLAGKLRLRERMLSRYNFILAPHHSPLNSRDAERSIEELLDGILKGHVTVRDLADIAFKLPRHRHDD